MSKPTSDQTPSEFELEDYRAVSTSAADELRLVYNMFTWGTLSGVAIAGWLASNVAVIADLGMLSRGLWWVPFGILIPITLGLRHSALTLKSHHAYLGSLEKQWSPGGVGWHQSDAAKENASRARRSFILIWLMILTAAFLFGWQGPELFGPQPTHVIYESVPPANG